MWKAVVVYGTTGGPTSPLPPPHTHTHKHKHTHKRKKKHQIYYVYGQRKSGDVDKSYQMGFGGGSYPRNPHHRATSCDDKGACLCVWF